MEFKGTKDKLFTYRIGGQNDSQYIFETITSCTCGEHQTHSEVGRFITDCGESIYDYANVKLFSLSYPMLEALQQVIRLRDIIEYDESIVNESNIGEASAISQMLNRIDKLIKEATEI